MIATFENEHNMYCIDRPMQVVWVSNGIVLPQMNIENGPMWGLGGVCDADNAFVSLSAYDGGWATHGGVYSWNEEEYVDCDVVYFGMFSNHWGHFLIDLIGRLWYFAKKQGEGLPLKLAYLGDEEPQPNFLEFFSLLGIRPGDLIHVKTPTRFRQVIVPEFSCKSCEWYSEEYRSIFDTMIMAVMREDFVPQHFNGIEKVYFSRQSFGKAKGSEIGEQTIVEWLQANGFVSIAPESLSVREQIYIWNHATEIACLNGSIPLNVAFCANSQLKLTVLNKTHLEHLNLELYLLMRSCDVTLLDVWCEPFKKYPKSIGAGPFLFHLGDDARAYCEIRGWVFPFTERYLKWQRRINYIKLANRIVNIKGRIRIAISKIVPSSIKRTVRGLLSHGK